MFIITTSDSSYEIQLYNNTINTDYSLTFIGYGYANPKLPNGQIINQNFVSLLQNFSNITPPENPINGQIWYDSNSESLNLYDEQWGLIYLQSDIVNAGFINELFLTQAQIEQYNFVNENYIQNQSFINETNLTNFVSLSQLNFNNYVTATTIENTISNSAETFLPLSELNNLITETSLTAMSYVTTPEIISYDYVTYPVLSGYISQNQEIVFSGIVEGTGTVDIYTELTPTGVIGGSYVQIGVNSGGQVISTPPQTNEFITNILGYTPTSFVGSSLLSQSGYQIFPNGLIIQWVYGTNDPADNTSPSQTISWQKPFPNAYFGGNVSTNLNNISQDCNVWYEILSGDVENVIVKRINISLNNNVTTTPFIIGYGY